jgi:hypothetical protein
MEMDTFLSCLFGIDDETKTEYAESEDNSLMDDCEKASEKIS